MVYDSSRQLVLLYGGRMGAAPAFSDLWAWDGATWTKIRTDFGTVEEGRFGATIVATPDLDGDGAADYLCGAPHDGTTVGKTLPT